MRSCKDIESERHGIPERDEINYRLVVNPFSLKVGHNLKRSVKKFDIPAIFLRRINGECCIPRLLNAKHGNRSAKRCHGDQLLLCHEGMVYPIPHSCRALWLGKTGWCAIEWLREHSSLYKDTTSFCPAVHVYDCGCILEFGRAGFIDRYTDRRTNNGTIGCRWEVPM